ncbi:orotate phosphoribosyltransferase [Caldanaerobacter subterraneus subsp. tengcongensis MB4]|uniref:Orotate phosphoribosyltransferase n=2 Tax=Caldanaerobacter subterraneus TaxID=911092 RepID=PYRE_CALS4|nr:orotate phosphoribosyltransferase [Caldanaerobacter subterraneus]P58858.1 RecName: Full=Orotate phosphoribosyltransferase; Short=OPRT; Short=OPRTase [Caldanaerobacter subterraneus subsp. tengcongensis MB4]AAM24740.1 Orotate phosphoribosyltransferase [Caldanaerobacter subterraneus subsp. tengcongensis MB4]KKC29480.1 orotate phosphoribosyltransferase [Caldanaerobacter subterraneus subsp. pacificus DSM 12653]MCS3915695.1 orotate phosphoribosyltransferase [Caldanaerobacter subterraneus subsp. te
MEKEKVLEIFEKLEVINKGHFLLSSGKHSDTYLQCAKIFQYPNYSEIFSRELAEKFKGYRIDVVIGPAIGGIILAYEVARQIGVRALFAEREDNVMKLRRGFEISKGERVLVVEDVVTTGGSVKEVIELVRSLGGEVIGVGTIVDRSDGKIDFGVPFESIVKLQIKTYEKEECPLCKEGIPLVKPGSRKL